jgi:short-subunit dehydrogenase
MYTKGFVMKLKKLKNQVIVITGASSGIGLVTARLAAKAGAKLVLAARSRGALTQLVDEITKAGGKAVSVVADVGDPDDVRAIARVAVEKFGGFDTWVNDAGVSIYGKVVDTPVKDMRRQFETNYWGVVYGSLEAVAHLRTRGGALINVGSTLSERAAILQGSYSASKHAVKGFTDALRMELALDNAPVSVTLIKPGPIDTPYTLNAKNYMDSEARHPAPAYAPELVARAILRAAQKPKREVFVGGGGRGIALLGVLAPPVSDAFMRKVMAPQSKLKQQPPSRKNALDAPSNRLQERGNFPGHTRETSLYTFSAFHRKLTGALLLGAALAFYVWRQGKSDGGDTPPSRPPSDTSRPEPAPQAPEPAPQAVVIDTVEVVDTPEGAVVIETVEVVDVADVGNVTAVMDRAEVLGEGTK